MFASQGIQNHQGSSRLSNAGLSHFAQMKARRPSASAKNDGPTTRVKTQKTLKAEAGKKSISNKVSGNALGVVLAKQTLKSSMASSNMSSGGQVRKQQEPVKEIQKISEGSDSSGTSSQSNDENDLDLDNLEAELNKLQMDEQKRLDKNEYEKNQGNGHLLGADKKRSSSIHFSDLNREDDLDNVTDDGRGHKLLNLDSNSGIPKYPQHYSSAHDNGMETQREISTPEKENFKASIPAQKVQKHSSDQKIHLNTPTRSQGMSDIMENSWEGGTRMSIQSNHMQQKSKFQQLKQKKETLDPFSSEFSSNNRFSKITDGDQLIQLNVPLDLQASIGKPQRNSTAATKGHQRQESLGVTSTNSREPFLIYDKNFSHEYFLNMREIENLHAESAPELKYAQDVRISNIYYNRLLAIEYISVFFSLFGMGLAIILNELSMNEEISQDQEYAVLIYIMLTNIALAVTLYVRYEVLMQWHVNMNMLTEFDTLISTGWWQTMCLEQLICLIAPYPFLKGIKYSEDNTNWNITVSYEVNQILMCLSFSRVYILMRWHLFQTKFMNPRSNRLCTMNGCEAGHMFALKSTMKQRPLTFLFYTLVLTIILFGYQLKVFEGPLSQISNQNFNLMSNAMWNVIITLTTTGYGDFYPKSLLGRIIGLIICFWGTFMVSFFVVTVNNMLTFTPSEEKSFNLLQRLHFKEELKEYAVNVLSSSFRHRNLRIRAQDENESRVIKALRYFRGKLLSFRQAVIRVRMFYEGESEMDILQRQIDDLHDSVKEMSQDQIDIKSGLDNAISMIEAINKKINDDTLNSSQITQALTDEIGSDTKRTNAKKKEASAIEEGKSIDQDN